MLESSQNLVHILDVKKLESTEVFSTDLKLVFDFIRFSKDKQKLKELISVKKREGGSMCQALKELLQDERAEGRIEGRIEGRTEGRTEGEACMLITLVKEGHISVELAAQKADKSVIEFQKLVEASE